MANQEHTKQKAEISLKKSWLPPFRFLLDDCNYQRHEISLTDFVSLTQHCEETESLMRFDFGFTNNWAKLTA